MILADFRVDVDSMFSIKSSHSDVPKDDVHDFSFRLDLDKYLEEGLVSKIHRIAAAFAAARGGRIKSPPSVPGMDPYSRVTIPYGDDYSFARFWRLGQELLQALDEIIPK